MLPLRAGPPAFWSVFWSVTSLFSSGDIADGDVGEAPVCGTVTGAVLGNDEFLRIPTPSISYDLLEHNFGN